MFHLMQAEMSAFYQAHSYRFGLTLKDWNVEVVSVIGNWIPGKILIYR